MEAMEIRCSLIHSPFDDYFMYIEEIDLKAWHTLFVSSTSINQVEFLKIESCFSEHF